MTGQGDTPATQAHVPDCSVHERCGGCALMALGHAAQRTEKLQQFSKHWRAAALPNTAFDWVLSDDAPVGYRNRVRCQVGPDGLVRFFNPEKIDACAVLEPSVRAGVDLAKRVALEHATAMSHFASLEIRGHDSSGRGAVNYRPRLEPAARSELGTSFARARVELLEAWPEPWLIAGLDDGPAPCQRWTLAPDAWTRVPVDAFMQINTRVNRLLVAHVQSGIVARGATSFADLFMGAGNFALPLLAAGLAGYAVEAHAGAVRAAQRAAQAQGLDFARVEAGDAARIANHWLDQGLAVDVVVTDPPRAGLGSAGLLAARLARGSVVLCSCNVRSLVRDVAALLSAGFHVERVALFDMFPQTPHVESVVWLDRQR